jgi:hypothetical protein
VHRVQDDAREDQQHIGLREPQALDGVRQVGAGQDLERGDRHPGPDQRPHDALAAGRRLPEGDEGPPPGPRAQPDRDAGQQEVERDGAGAVGRRDRLGVQPRLEQALGARDEQAADEGQRRRPQRDRAQEDAHRQGDRHHRPDDRHDEAEEREAREPQDGARVLLGGRHLAGAGPDRPARCADDRHPAHRLAAGVESGVGSHRTPQNHVSTALPHLAAGNRPARWALARSPARAAGGARA